MVFVIALNKERRKLFVWRCEAVREARGIVRRLSVLFGHCLHNITLNHKSRDAILHNQAHYDDVVNFTYENARDWYVVRQY
jgi:hypothetical protein